ncbi:Glutaredoxin [Macleaya cordata]|uniref:Glutaredoxin n=1 Tax=Macleaya cordata TaxID=56857 RepID=A0A200QEY3_MACCD|nr:Glutaredoxin [Macleaya cordata]
MGCANSKRSQTRCGHCKRPYSPHVHSSSSSVHQPIQRKGKNHHLVALTSSAISSIRLDSLDQHQSHLNNHNDQKKDSNSSNKDCSKNDNKSNEFSMGFIQEKISSSNNTNETSRKIIPKTPTRTPPGEPETINTWELMEGLDDENLVPDHCFSFHTVFNSTSLDQSNPILQMNGTESPKPLWLEMVANESNTCSNSIISDFDPEIISTFRKALEELSPRNSFKLRSSGTTSPCNNRLLIKDPPMETKKVSSVIAETKCPPFGHDKVVIYFTSLRGVRKTYEDCCYVRMVLKDCGIRIDERDVSMHNGFREELIELLGDGFSGKLPRVFVKGLYIGGAEEVRQMHEDGKLEKVLEGCEVAEDGVCEVCGDVRFVPCESCSGSCKIYCEEVNEDDDADGGIGGFQRCPYCNENGIIRCPVCCY